MKRTRNKDLKQLSKAHIWPSVVFIFLTLLTACIAYFIMLLMSLLSLTQERMNNACETTTLIVNNLDSGIVDTIDLLRQHPDLYDGFFVYDANGEEIVGAGAQTFTKDRLVVMGSSSEEMLKYEIYADIATESMLNFNDEEMVGNIFDAIREKLSSADLLDNESVMFEMPFWLRTELTEGKYSMVKCSTKLYFSDLSRTVSASSLAFILIVIPIFFLFINILIGVHNQRRMRKLLYLNTVTGGRSYIYYEHQAARMLRSKLVNSSRLMFVDLTLMKYRSFCNYHGIHAGEALLESIDKAITDSIGSKELCALNGKASFALLLRCSSREDGRERVDKLIEALTQKLGHNSICFHAGICFTDSLLSDNNKIMLDKNAYDPAVYYNCAGAARASLTDENTTQTAVYNDQLMEAQIWEHKVEEKMENALSNEEFQVYIQPKYDPTTEKLAGAEALVRWISPEDGFISPGRFIPIFEKNGFITKLDDYMIEHVARLQSEWIKQGKQVVPISVNVSRAHFANPQLASHICGIVDQFGVPHSLIEIELTESAFFDDRELMLKTVHSLRKMGFEISMDDFGAGYSSLNSLKDLPLDVLKLDADFFRGEDSRERGEIVVSQAISLAKKLNMRIVAEGIEKKEQVEFLAKQGCDMIQGFYYAKPMPADEYAQNLDRNESKVDLTKN